MAFGIAYDDGEVIAAFGKLGPQERVIADMAAYGDNAFALCKGLLKVLDALDGDTLSELGLIAAAVEEKLKPVFCKKSAKPAGRCCCVLPRECFRRTRVSNYDECGGEACLTARR